MKKQKLSALPLGRTGSWKIQDAKPLHCFKNLGPKHENKSRKTGHEDLTTPAGAKQSPKDGSIFCNSVVQWGSGSYGIGKCS